MATPTPSPESVDGSSSENADDELILRRRKHKSVSQAIEGLNLTAMMDVMTIILVFLLKQYEAAPENIQLTEDMMPPKSTTEDDLVPGVRLMVSKTAVIVDNKKVLNLVNGQPVGLDGTPGWTPLAKKLEQRRSEQEALSRVGGSPFDGSLMVVADAETPYDVLTNVLYTAGKEQYTTYRLVLQLGGQVK